MRSVPLAARWDEVNKRWRYYSPAPVLWWLLKRKEKACKKRSAQKMYRVLVRFTTQNVLPENMKLGRHMAHAIIREADELEPRCGSAWPEVEV